MADTELHETDSEDQKDWQAETDADAKDTDTNETDEADDDYGVSMDKVQAVLNATADKSEMTPQMQRMMSRQAENTRRVEETIKHQVEPALVRPAVLRADDHRPDLGRVYYLSPNGTWPIPGIGAWTWQSPSRSLWSDHHDDVVALSGEIPSRQPAPYRR